MRARIKFRNGTELTAEQRDSCFITDEQPTFPADLSVVTIISDSGIETLHFAMVQPCAPLDDRYWFTFVERSQLAVMFDALMQQNEINAGAIAELAELIAGGE